jgi:hypothetical protein
MNSKGKHFQKAIEQVQHKRLAHDPALISVKRGSRDDHGVAGRAGIPNKERVV